VKSRRVYEEITGRIKIQENWPFRKMLWKGEYQRKETFIN
jgi:hypothetical protein